MTIDNINSVKTFEFVNLTISSCHVRMTIMPKGGKKRADAFDPVFCLTSVFTARRDLLEPINNEVLNHDSPVTVDEADALIFLFGISNLAWHGLRIDEEGYVAISDLRSVLVHDRGLFSRRIQKLEQDGLIEGKQPVMRKGNRRYVKRVRITNAGVKVARPIWERYRKLAARLLAGLSQHDLEIQCRVNQHISKTIVLSRNEHP
jgi:DNA-binding MarR family transcriptional regulator